MNVKLLCRLLGILSVLIGGFMLFSLIWASPSVGFHTDPVVDHESWERAGIRGLLLGTLVSWAVGGLLIWLGRGAEKKVFRKEAMAVVGLSWLLATFLGALPYLFSGTSRGPSIRFFDNASGPPMVLVAKSRASIFSAWREVEDLSDDQYLSLIHI